MKLLKNKRLNKVKNSQQRVIKKKIIKTKKNKKYKKVHKFKVPIKLFIKKK